MNDKEHIAALEAKLAIAREALEFYSDESRYRGPNQSLQVFDKYSEEAGLKAYMLDVTRDEGAIAIRALAALGDAQPAMTFEEIRDAIADAVESWPHNEYWPPKIAESIRRIGPGPEPSMQPASAEVEPVAWRVAHTFPRSDFTAGTPHKETIDYWREQGVELEYAYTHPSPTSDEITKLREQLAAAQAEVEKLKEQHHMRYRMWHDEAIKRQELQGEVETLRKDAERYRWLRDSKIADDAQWWISAGVFDMGGVSEIDGPGLDAAIDAAMKGER